MNSIKDFVIGAVFIFVCSVSLLFFALDYPALNNGQSVLIENPAFNETAQNLSILLGQDQSNINRDINITTADEPQASAQGLYLVSSTATSRFTMGQLTDRFKLLTNLLGSVFGLNGGQFTLISASLISLFSFVLLFLTIKYIRWGN